MGEAARFKAKKVTGKKGKDYPGVYFIMGTDDKGKPEKIYYIKFYRKGERHFEKAGRARQDGMTPLGAANLRSAKIRGEILPNKEQREADRAAKKAEEGRYTIDKLWTAYKESHPDLKGIATDESRYALYLEDSFGPKEPAQIDALSVERLRVKIAKSKEPATVKNVLELLRRIVNYGAKKNLAPPLPFRITFPKVNNQKTEDLSPTQMTALLTILKDGAYQDKEGNTVHVDPDVCDMMKLALFSGMRRGEMFRLEWPDVDFRRGFITIRGPKGGTDQSIPLNEEAGALLKAREETKGESVYVFPGRGGEQRVDARKRLNEIKKAAGLPEDFRPLHGLRHVFASMLASSGEVDLYTLQKLLTHKSPTMTQRYAHLRDEAMRKASNVAGRIVAEHGNGNTA